MTGLVESRPGIWSRLFRFLGPRALFTWVLTLILLLTVAYSMTSNISAVQNSFVTPVVFLAFSLGWMISQLHIKTIPGAIVGLVFGTEYLLIRVGGLEDSVWTIAKALGVFFGSY